MSDTGFTKKRLALTITLGTGEFGEDVGSTVTLSGLRMTADIVMAAGEFQDTLQLRVYGLSQSMMNKLTTIGPVAMGLLGKNKVVVAAGDDVSGMQVVYEGSIIYAWADYSTAPDAIFNLMAQAGYVGALKPVDPVSYSGSTDVAMIMSGLAKTMGLAFENNGVSAKLSDPYFDGTALTQVQTCAHDANIMYTIDRGVLVIWPKKGSRAGDTPLISPETGMIGYPSFSSDGMSVSCVFNQNIRVGGLGEVRSSLRMACKTWKVMNVLHSLSSEMPGGPWLTTMRGWRDEL